MELKPFKKKKKLIKKNEVIKMIQEGRKRNREREKSGILDIRGGKRSKGEQNPFFYSALEATGQIGEEQSQKKNKKKEQKIREKREKKSIKIKMKIKWPRFYILFLLITAHY